MHYARAARHGDPEKLIIAPRGAGTMSAKGYRMHRIKGKEFGEHIIVAERALGRPLPKGAIVHHVNENPGDNRPQNLVICQSRAYHMLLHQRMRAIDACGHADWRKCQHCQKYDDPKNLKITTSGVCHIECKRLVERNRWKEKQRRNT